MNFDKKTILAFLLIGLVFLLVQTPFYKKMFFPHLYQQEQIKKVLADSLRSPSPAPSMSEEESNNEHQKMATSLPLVNNQAKEKIIIVETALYKATFSSHGALLTSWTLKRYTTGFGEPVQLLPDPSQGNLGLAFVDRNGDSTSTADLFFTCTEDTLLDATTEKKSLQFVLDLGEGKRIIKEMEFFPNTYHFQFTTTLQNMEQIISDKAYSLSLPSGLSSTEKRVNEDMSYAKAIIAASGEYSKHTKANGQTLKETGSIDWIAIRTKYFLLAIIPQTSKGIYTQTTGKQYVSTVDSKAKWKQFIVTLTMPFTRSDYREAFTVFLGPMDDEILKSYQVGLENSMDMGMKIIQPISTAVLWTFKKLHTYINNYGLVLVLFSLLIKIITTPLTNKSYSSMKKMQALQPQMNALKEKYSKDPQRLNKETMKLYKEQGINPMGGCFPVLLQIPIFIALFNVFRSTIELRQQGFFSWIKDLSGPDTIATVAGIPINILPILMGVTMILQQKMSVTDPKQKAMVYMMPAIMIFMFYSFPSGLNLYYTIFNILAILQQKYLQPAA